MPLEKMLRTTMQKRNIPSGTEIVHRQILHRLQQVDESDVPAVVFDKLGPILDLDSISVKRKGDVRQAKLFYLRDRSGKSARIKERLE